MSDVQPAVNLPNGIEWVDPPVTQRQRPASIDWGSLVDQLCARPNTWAKVRHFASKSSASSYRAQIRKGRLHPELFAGVEAAAGPAVEGGSDLYLRFVGAQPAQAVA